MATRSERERPGYQITDHDLERIKQGVFKRKKKQDRNLRLVKSGGLQMYDPADFPTEKEEDSE